MRELIYESYYTAESPEELFLMHHGIKGQKWGVRRFQNSDGSLTAAGKARYLTGKAKEYIANKYKEHKIASEQRKVEKAAFKEELKKAREEKEEKIRKAKEEKRIAEEQRREEETEADMQDAIAKGDQARVSKYVSRMTTQQLQDAVNRVRLNQQLDQLAPNQKSMIEKVGDKAQKVANLNNSIKNAVNSYRDLKKLFKSDDDSEDDSNYTKSLDNARNAAATAARNDAKSKGGSLFDQEVAARKAIKEFDEASKKSKNYKDTDNESSNYKDTDNESSNNKLRPTKSSLLDKQKAFSAKIKDLSGKEFNKRPTGSYIEKYWKKQRTPLKSRVDDLNERLKYLD